MEIDLKEDFEIIEEGTCYQIPAYEVVDGKGIERLPIGQRINFVRGSKLGEEQVEKRVGSLHEHIINMLIHDLKFKNGLVPSRETSLAITKLEEALMWLRQRQIDRVKRQTLSTYQK